MQYKSFAASVALASTLALGVSQSWAQAPQYTGPGGNASTSGAAYTGPSSVELVTVKQLLDSGRDDQIVRVQGKIVSYDGDGNYTFEDATGRMSVDIDNDAFPPGQSISAEQRVELLGEFDKDRRKVELDVERITLIP